MKTSKPLLLLVLLSFTLLGPSVVRADPGSHVWSNGWFDGGQAAMDDAGNVVIHGAFFGPVDFGGGLLSPVNFFDGDQYLARFDPDGNHLWSVQFSPDGFGIGSEIVTTDPAGNIYVAGNTFANTTIDYGGGDIGATSLYVAKFNSSGVHQWSAGFGDGWPRDIAADGSQVVVTGYTSAGVDFGGGAVGTAGGNDVFVGSLDAATGAHTWSAGFGDTDDQGGMAVDIDGAGNVVLVGSFLGNIDLGGGNLAAGGLDLFLASFTAAGVHNWSQDFDGTFTPGGGIAVTTDVACGPTGEVAIAGQMLNSVDFGGGLLTSLGFGDAYVAVFDAGGIHKWSDTHGSSTATESVFGITIRSTGTVIIGGIFAGDTDFGGGVIALNGDPLSGANNLFLAEYDGDGNHLFSQGYGERVYSAGLDLDGSDGLLVHGGGGSAIDMGGGAISPTGLFVARFGEGGGTSAAGDVPQLEIPLRAAPNPFNPTTVIAYELRVAATAAVAVFDVRGHLVERLVPERAHAAGLHRVRFSARESGVYLVQLRVAGKVRTLKMVAVK